MTNKNRAWWKEHACRRPRKRQPSTPTIDHCLFLLVDVDHSALFYWSKSTTAFFYWSTSTILLFSTGRRRPHFYRSKPTDCLFLCGWWSTLFDIVDARRRCRRPFYSPFHHAPKTPRWFGTTFFPECRLPWQCFPQKMMLTQRRPKNLAFPTTMLSLTDNVKTSWGK